jgi:hypothetical protein
MSIKQTVTVDEVITFLNELIALDKPAIAALLDNHVPCNEALANHQTVQVSAQHGGWHVGLLGIINGLFGVDDTNWGAICYEFEDGDLIRFKRTPSDHPHNLYPL